MEDYDLIKCERRPNGIVIHHVASKDGETRIVKYSDVRAGLSWPQASAPAYYCMLGEEFLTEEEGIQKQKGGLRWFAEYEFPGLSLNDFFAKLTDDCVQFGCHKIYTDMGENCRDFVIEFGDYVREKSIRQGDLDPAPFVDNFFLGVSIIEDWTRTKRLELPQDTIVYEQLKRITKPDLEESPELIFYAVNALCFVVAAFHKYRPYHSPKRRPRMDLGPHGWMVA